MFFNFHPQDHESHISTHPLFCFSVASHALLILYFPHILLSPLFFLFALASLLLSTNISRHIDFRGFPTQLPHNRSDHAIHTVSSNAETDALTGTEASSEDIIRDQNARQIIDKSCIELAGAVQSGNVFHSFVDFGMKWPLDVIYEDQYEWEAKDDEEEKAGANRDCINEKESSRVDFEEWRFFLPDSDDDTGSSGSSELEEYDYVPPELPTWESMEMKDILMWKEEKVEEEMIEFRFEGKTMEDEESLIEIDLSLHE